MYPCYCYSFIWSHCNCTPIIYIEIYESIYIFNYSYILAAKFKDLALMHCAHAELQSLGIISIAVRTLYRFGLT